MLHCGIVTYVGCAVYFRSGQNNPYRRWEWQTQEHSCCWLAWRPVNPWSEAGMKHDAVFAAWGSSVCVVHGGSWCSSMVVVRCWVQLWGPALVLHELPEGWCFYCSWCQDVHKVIDTHYNKMWSRGGCCDERLQIQFPPSASFGMKHQGTSGAARCEGTSAGSWGCVQAPVFTFCYDVC
jgi:hypothetical protein